MNTTQEKFYSVLRHALSAVAALLVAIGVGTEGLLMELSGLVLAGVSIFFSVKNKNFGVNQAEGFTRQALTAILAFGAVLSEQLILTIPLAVGAVLTFILGLTSKSKTPAEGAENK